jgi:hypothetical protein
MSTSTGVSIEAALLDETVEMVLDSRQAVCEVLANSMAPADLDALLRELAVELLDTYHTVVGDDLDDQEQGVES